jgi:transposase
MDEMKQMIERLLSIPLIKVLSVEIKPSNEVFISVESRIEGTICHQCGSHISAIHSLDEPLYLRHLPILGHQTYLVIRPKRYVCQSCSGRPTTTQKPDWYSSKSRCTKAYEQHLLLSLVNSTIQDAAIKERIGYKTIEAIVERSIGEEIDWEEVEKLKFDQMGIDEVALRKGHKHYVAILTLRLKSGEVKVLGVLEDRKKDTVKAFLEQIPERVRERIKSVCTDMYKGFTEAVREVMGEAVIVIDRFHVAKLYGKCADDLRKREMRRLKREMSEEEYEQIKGVMWIFRKREEDLEEEEKVKLEKLFSYAPELEKAYRLREGMRAIFEKKMSKGKAKREIIQWEKEVSNSGLKCFDKFLETMNEWKEEITNYFIKRSSSGFVEGFNNKVKVMKRRCYGIINVVHFFKRLVIDVEGYRRFATN